MLTYFVIVAMIKWGGGKTEEASEIMLIYGTGTAAAAEACDTPCITYT
jgi:hypothetical protein